MWPNDLPPLFRNYSKTVKVLLGQNNGGREQRLTETKYFLFVNYFVFHSLSIFIICPEQSLIEDGKRHLKPAQMLK